jgi:DNA-directed RNA polymerase subunit RPC12/RpoP
MTGLHLLPDENVEWTVGKGFFSLSLILAFCAIICGGVLALFGFFGGESNGNPFPPNPILGWSGFALFLLGVGYMVVSLAVAKSTRYLLTNHRIVEVRFGKVVKEIMLADFMGKPISQFFDKRSAGTVNGEPVYDVCITNPKSLNPIEFKSVSESGMEALERILERARQVVRCRYCSTDNSATSFVCSNCGAPLS